ncbi:MAG: hypothetical protein ABI700_31590, partial [Chloroflexota bacterium]
VPFAKLLALIATPFAWGLNFLYSLADLGSASAEQREEPDATEQLGKTAGIDLEQGRGFAATYENDEQQAEADMVTSLKEKILQGDAINEAHEQANRLVDLAISYLGVLPASEAKDSLIDLARLIVERSY